MVKIYFQVIHIATVHCELILGILKHFKISDFSRFLNHYKKQIELHWDTVLITLHTYLNSSYIWKRE